MGGEQSSPSPLLGRGLGEGDARPAPSQLRLASKLASLRISPLAGREQSSAIGSLAAVPGITVLNGWNWVESGHWRSIARTQGPSSGEREMKWLATIGSIIALTVAMLSWGLTPASECSTSHSIDWWRGLSFFATFVVAGGFIAARGNTAQRVLLFLTSAAVIAGYVAVLSQSLPIVIQTEIGCTA